MEQFILNFVKNPESYYLEDDNRIIIRSNPEIRLDDVVFYRIDRITYEDKAPRKEALENVLSAMRIKGVNFIYLIKGDKRGVSFYYGIARDLIQTIPITYSMGELGEMVLKPSLDSNFRGSKVTKLSDSEEQGIIDTLAQMKFVGSLDGVPGINGDNENYQGMDRMVDAMMGDEFAFLVIAKALPTNAVRHFERNIYEFYDRLVPLSKKTVQKGENNGTTTINNRAEGENHSDAHQDQEGKTTNFGKTTQDSRTTKSDYSDDRTESFTTVDATKAYQKSKTTSDTHTDGTSLTTTTGTNVSEGESKSTSYDFSNKDAQEWLKYIDDVILKRLDYGKGKGMFISTISLFTMNEASMLKLENTVTALFSGDSGNKVPLRKLALDRKGQRQDVLRNFQIPIAELVHEISENEVFTRTALSQYVTKERAFLGNWFSTNELGIIAGIPQKEIVGLALREEVEFGLNYNSKIKEKDKVVLGNMVQSGNELQNISVSLDRNELRSHVFVVGATGGGKTTTCQTLLLRSKMPFLVIEPAKTEYRLLTKKLDDVLIFTLGKDRLAPFRLNPFEFYSHESISSHVDMVMASIKAAFDMEAAIPQVIERAIYACYEDCGWDVANDTNKYYTTEEIDKGAFAFPTLGELLKKVEKVVLEQGFDDRLRNDYIGSIKARLQSLTLGSKGLMLNTKRSLDFRELVHKKVIIELEEVRSGSEKALIMGFVLSCLREAIKEAYSKDPDNFSHITLVEEAHRLLGKYEPGDSLTKKQGVEMFADMLAEVRKYGEALMIVDQIPGKMTPEVLKNTNTKIVHKIFAQDDKEAIGNTMALSREQKEFLSFLDKGRAVVFSQGWDSSIQVQIAQETYTDKAIIDEETIRARAIEYYCKTYFTGIFPSLRCCGQVPTREVFEEHLKYQSELKSLTAEFESSIEGNKATKRLETAISKLENILSLTEQAKFICEDIYYKDSEEKRLNEICSLLFDVKNGKMDLTKYDDLNYERRIRK